MWFARLFGSSDDDSEPSEFPPHPAANVTKAPSDTSRPSARTDLENSKKAHLPKGKGFDPYNSGSFDKQKAWERVLR